MNQQSDDLKRLAEAKQDQAFCQSYYDEDNNLKNCTCGRCEEARKATKSKTYTFGWRMYITGLIAFAVFAPLFFMVDLDLYAFTLAVISLIVSIGSAVMNKKNPND